jgi:hypothetical protein
MMPALCCLAGIALFSACKPAAAPVAAPSGAAVPGSGATEPNAGAVLLRRSGGVELQRGSGRWSAASEGDRIFGADAVRTGPDAEAEISVDGVRVSVLDHSELRVSRAVPGTLRARIRGRVESVVEPGKGTIALQVQDSDVVASSSGGHFFVTADGQGAIAVGTLSGAVALEGGGRTVEVRGGQVSRLAGATPAQPTAALRKVLFAVRWPANKTNLPSLPLSGRVEPGSRVYVQGRPVEVAPSGEFHTDVVVREGKQRIAVVSIDPLGQRRQRESELTRDDSPPVVELVRPWRKR